LPFSTFAPVFSLDIHSSPLIPAFRTAVTTHVLKWLKMKDRTSNFQLERHDIGLMKMLEWNQRI
jgi:hypothetical protein